MSTLVLPGDIVTGDELTREDYMLIGNKALELQQQWDSRFETGTHPPQELQDVEIVSFFECPSLRTKMAQLMGVKRWGARSEILDWNALFKRSDGAEREDIREVVQTLEGSADFIAARVLNHDKLTALQNARTRARILNLLSPHSHPQQALAHLALLLEKFGDRIHDIKWAWVGDFTNVAYSVLMMLSKIGIREIAVATPPQEKYSANEERRERLEDLARGTGTRIVWTNNASEAVIGADVVGTDTFTSMGQEAEEEERLSVFLPNYQVNEELLKATGKNPAEVLFHHCLPAHRGQEVTDQVLDAHREVIREAELRNPAQAASMRWSIQKRVDEHRPIVDPASLYTAQPSRIILPGQEKFHPANGGKIIKG